MAEEFVKVEILAEYLKGYGAFRTYPRLKAMSGQQQGLWRIIEDNELYEDKEMKPGDYLKKTKFRRGLTFRNLYGEDKRK